MIKTIKSFRKFRKILDQESQKRSVQTFKYLSIILMGSFFIISCGSMWEAGSMSETRSRVNYSNNGLPSEPGKCYAKCLMQDVYETYEEELLVYTGQDFEQEGVELTKIIFKPATTKWEKKRSPDCKSADPNDCLVWCMVDVPEVSKDYYLVSDTSKVVDYKIENVSYREIVKSGGFTEWREVVCEADISQSLYQNIQLALISNGFLKDTPPDGKIGKTTKEALVQYQKSNGLPVGSLDFETLDHLGVQHK